MSNNKQAAGEFLRQFKGDNYVFGLGCVGKVGPLAASLGKRAAQVNARLRVTVPADQLIFK